MVIETVKQAEKDNDIIVRLYESKNGSESVNLKFGFNVSKAYITDMLENVLEEIPVTDNTVNISLSNFEILTLKVSPKN